VVEDHDAVTGTVRLDGLAYRGDNAGGLVSEDAGGGMGAGENFFEVGSANAAGVNADEQLAGADLGDGDGFQADIVYTAVDRSLHGRGDRILESFDRVLSGNGHEMC
jgi:hypothetical protein